MARNKSETKQKLIDAVGRIIKKDGFSNIGINSVAKEAGVDKVLIYRYFKNIDGLLKSYINQKDYFINIPQVNDEDEKLSTEKEILNFGKNLFKDQIKYILKSKELQEILLWELITKNSITTTIAEEREKHGLERLKKIKKSLGKTEADIAGISAIILAGIYYLTLRSREVDVFNGINLQSKHGWNRIEKSIDFILEKSLK